MSGTYMVKFLLPAGLALTAATILELSSWADDDACLHRTVSLTAADRELAPIPDLRPEDFRGEFRGKPVKIRSIVADERPHRIVIILDASGSIGPPPHTSSQSAWPLERQMASHMVEIRPRETTFALLIFNDKVIDQIDFSQGLEAVVEKLRQIGADSNYQKAQVKGRTAIWDTLLVGLGLLHDPTSADAVYLITDGGEDASRASSTDVRRRLAASGSRVFVSLMVSSADKRNPTPEELNGPEEMSKIAHATGGAIFGPIAQGNLGPVLLATDSNQNLTISSGLHNFYKTMLGGYRIEIELPSPVDKWREWKLELTKEKQKQFKHSQLGYTRDLEPCTGAAKVKRESARVQR
jgi:hypothetical protein